MHISLDSVLGRQRRLNQVGETISSIAAPTAAYSLRSITGGDPKALRVRRSSDNSEQDFTVSEIHSGALVSFVGSGNDGFVDTWYDQSGNSNDLTQDAAAKQPTIVTSGTLNTRNGEPVVKFIQANLTHLLGPSTVFPTGTDIALTVFNALHVDASSGNRSGAFGHNGQGNDPASNKYLTGNTGSRRTILKTKDASGTVVLTQPNTGVPNDADAIITYFSSISDGTQTHESFNLGAILQTTITASCTDQSYETGNPTILGARTISDNFSDSEIFEAIAYDSDQRSNRNAIEANMSSKYGIPLS